jgi:hypothetical protein
MQDQHALVMLNVLSLQAPLAQQPASFGPRLPCTPQDVFVGRPVI